MISKSPTTSEHLFGIYGHFLTWLFCVSFNLVFSQEVVINAIEVNNNGKSATIQKALFVDHKDFLWYSTYHGVVNYTGSESIFYSIQAPTPSNREVLYDANDIFESSDGMLWITSRGSILGMNLNNGKKVWLNDPVFNDKNFIHFMSIAEDHSGNVWFSLTAAYLYCRLPSGEFKRIRLKLAENSEGNVMRERDVFMIGDILEDNSIVLYGSHHIYKVQPNGSATILFSTSDPDKTDQKRCLISTKNGELLPENESGTYEFEGKEYAYLYDSESNLQFIELPFVSPLKYAILNGGLFRTPHNVLVSAEGNKLSYFDFRKENHTTHFQKLGDYTFKSEISTLKVGKDNDVWVNAEDIYKVEFKNHYFEKFLYHNPEEDSQAQAVSCRGLMEVDNGDVLIFTYQGFYKQEKGKKTFEKVTFRSHENGKEYPLDLSYNAKKQNDSIIWGFGFSDNLYKINLRDNSFQTVVVPEALSGSAKAIMDILFIDDHKLWLCGPFGLIEYDEETGSFENRSLLNNQYDLTMKNVYAIYQSENEDIWIAAGGQHGVYRIRKENSAVEYYSTETGAFKLIDNNVRCFLEDKEGNLWMGSEKGIQRVNLTTYESVAFTKENGLLDTNITGLLDDESNIWAGTFNGLLRINKKSGKITQYYEKDGITHNEFNIRSSFKASDGYFYMGGLNGVTGFHPSEFKNFDEKKEIRLIGYEMFMKDYEKDSLITLGLDSTKNLSLSYFHNYLTLSFAINDLSNPEKDVYLYKIAQIDSTWVNMGNYNKVLLRGLTPGNYTLEVKGISKNGIPTNILSYQIKIQQVFYKQWWFFAMVLVVACTVVFLWTNHRGRILKFKLAQKAHISLLEARALRSLMNPHFIFNAVNSMQSVLFLKSETEANKFFSSFAKLLRITVDMSNLDSILLSDELNYLEDYIEFEGMRFEGGIQAVFDIEYNLPVHQIRIPSMLFQPLVENAILHGLTLKEKDRKIIISIHRREQTEVLHVTIADNGIGRNHAARTSKEKREHVSKATIIMNDRIKTYNKLNSTKMSLTYIDLKDKDERPCGTEVVLIVPYKWDYELMKQQMTG